jgi:hypothetical protein
LIVEGTIVDFSGESVKTVSFNLTHSSVPVVSVTPEGTDADVNLYITAISTTQVVIKASEDFSGNVHIQAWSS